MRRIASIALLAALAAAAPARAQERVASSGDEANAFEAARAQIQADRTQLVAANLNLSEAEAAKFWPVYNEYRDDVRKLYDRGIDVTAKIVDGNIPNDETAEKLLDQYLKFGEDRAKLKRSYLGKFKKVLPGTKVARYYQIENKLDAAIGYEMAKAIPLVGE